MGHLTRGFYHGSLVDGFWWMGPFWENLKFGVKSGQVQLPFSLVLFVVYFQLWWFLLLMNLKTVTVLWKSIFPFLISWGFLVVFFFFVFFGIFITFTCFRSSILVFTFSFHFNPYTVSQGDASLDQGGNHCWPKTTRRPVSHFAKKHLEIFCELTRQKLNFLEGFSPATSDIKLTQHFMKITTYQQSNSVVWWSLVALGPGQFVVIVETMNFSLHL